MSLSELQNIESVAWHAAVHAVTKGRTQLSDWTTEQQQGNDLLVDRICGALSSARAWMWFYYIIASSLQPDYKVGTAFNIPIL